MKLEILDDSKNYTCQVIRLPQKMPVKGLDNLVEVNVQGNSCLTGKDADPNVLYLFFPVECIISHDFLSNNNLYRHKELNQDKEQGGFFEDNKRVKAIKFKGVISSGFVIPVTALSYLNIDLSRLECGYEFNSIDGQLICHKFVKKKNLRTHEGNKQQKLINEIVDKKLAPEHFDTAHLLKYLDSLSLNDQVKISYKLHGTSARYFNTLVRRQLPWYEKVLKWFGINVKTEDYGQVCASRRVVKSVEFKKINEKNHFYSTGDLWSMVGKEYFADRLFQGEAVYCEIIGKTYGGEAIQHGYTYGFNKPKLYVYRISNINPQGIEIDLPYEQMKVRAFQLGLEVCPEFFSGTLKEFLKQQLNLPDESVTEENKESLIREVFYEKLLEKPSILDSSVVEEGFCIRKDTYPKPAIFKIKSKKFLLHESIVNSDENLTNIEDEQSEMAIND